MTKNIIKIIILACCGLISTKSEYSCLQSMFRSITTTKNVIFIYDKQELFEDIFEKFRNFSKIKIISSIISYKRINELYNLESNDIYIIISTHQGNFEDILLKLHMSRLYNIKSIIVVIHSFELTSFHSEANYIVQYIISKLWALNMVDAVLIDANINKTVYTYKPITLGHNKNATPIKLGLCASLQINISIFKERSLRYFDNVDNTTDIDKNHGYEIAILKIALEQLHLKVSDFTFGKDIGYGKNVYNEMFEQIYRGEADWLVCYVRLTKMKHLASLSATIPINLAFAVPKAKPEAAWKNVFLIFKWGTWLGLIVTLIITSITRYLILKYYNVESRESPFGSFLYIFRNFITTVERQPKSKFFSLRMLFIFFTFGSLLILAYYQSQLSSFQSKPVYNKPISTMAELASSDLQIGGAEIHRRMFADTPKIYNKWVNCFNPVPCTEYFTRHQIKEYVLFDDKRRKPLLFPELLLMPVDACLYIGPVAVKGSVFADRYHEVINEINAAGMFEMLIARKTREAHRTTEAMNKEKVNRGTIIISLGVLYLIFFLWIAGLAISCIVFINEVYSA